MSSTPDDHQRPQAPSGLAARTPTLNIADERWQQIPFPRAEYTIANEQDQLLVLMTVASLAEVEEFYRYEMAQEGWLLFEHLSSTENRFGGEVRYLMFWRSIPSSEQQQENEVACILAASDDADDVTVTLSRECVVSRVLATTLRIVLWVVTVLLVAGLLYTIGVDVIWIVLGVVVLLLVGYHWLTRLDYEYSAPGVARYAIDAAERLAAEQLEQQAALRRRALDAYVAYLERRDD